jgi:uncharacterized protein YndB with AHSA1/START domain
MKDTAPAARSVVIEREMPYPPEKLWRALTQGALLGEWLMANDFEPLVGRRFTFRAPATPYWNGVTECEVLVVEPHTRLAYSWSAAGEEAARGPKTVVTWTLKPTPKGVLVRMEQSGFTAGQERNIEGANYGWKRFVDSLERVLASEP